MLKQSHSPEEESFSETDQIKYHETIEDSERVNGIINNVSNSVKDVLNNTFVKKGMYRILDSVDENHMEGLRAIWAKTPDEVKWAAMYMPALFKGNPALIHLLPLHVLVKCGLLDYPEKSIQHSANLGKKVLEYGIKYGKYLEPALAAVEPLIKPIQKVLDLEEKFFSDMRTHLKNKKGKTASGETLSSGEAERMAFSA